MSPRFLLAAALFAGCTGEEDTGPANDAPRVTILTPADNSAFVPGAPIEVCVSLADETAAGSLSVAVDSDVDGALASGAGTACGDGGLGWQITLSDATHEVTVTAVDPAGDSGTDAVTLFPTPNAVPTCAFTAPPPSTTLTLGADLALEATAADDLTAADALVGALSSDIDGLVWSGSPDGDGTVSALVTPSEGFHTYTLTVTDEGALVGTCAVTVTVEGCLDVDGDLVTTCDGDCDDGADTVYPGADEIPDDTVDQDCNGFDTVSCLRDFDGDGFGIQLTVYAPDGSCDPLDQEAEVAGDCDDADPDVWPGAPEIVDDGIDQDCDDFDTITCIVDADFDGYGTEDGDTTLADDGQCDRLQGESTNDEDCDDDAADIHPGAPEIAGNGIDENCDGEDTSICYADLDDDGFGDPDAIVVDEDCAGALQSTTGGDCDDGDDDIYPGAPELCDGLHNDCTQWVGGLPNLAATEVDDDGDDAVECAPWVGPGPISGGDCDDDEPAIYPGAIEVCDGLHNDCDDAGWPSLDPDEFDHDSDGHVECFPWVGDVGTDGGDCDDDATTVFPGAPELCDGLANNCNADDWPSTPADELDGDDDGFVGCDPWVGGSQLEGDDCDDGEATVYPEATELCDGQLNDCDGVMLPGEVDTDGDQYTVCTLDPGGWDGAGLVIAGDDCDDGEATVYPGASELCDGLHNDCDAPGWPSVPATETDDDDDDFVECGVWVGADTTIAGGDCDDGSSVTFPGAAQAQGGACMRDADDDGYGDELAGPGVTPGTDCVDDPAGVVDIDGNTIAGASINPVVGDVLYDGVDANCDEQNDFDWDNDGYTHEDYDGYTDADAPYEGDCDDGVFAVHPDATEIWYDGQDRDCSGGSDFDADGDGEDCDGAYPGAPCPGHAGADCNDDEPAIPGTEQHNAVDDDCDWYCDEGFISAGTLVINEFMLAPNASQTYETGQYLEVFNPTGVDVLLCDGWSVTTYHGDSFAVDWEPLGVPRRVPAGGHALFLAWADPAVNGGINYEPKFMYPWELSPWTLHEFGQPQGGAVLYYGAGPRPLPIDSVVWEAGWPVQVGKSTALRSDYINMPAPLYVTNDNPEYWCVSQTGYGDGDRGTPLSANDDATGLNCAQQ